MSNLAKLPVALPKTNVPFDVDPETIGRSYASSFSDLGADNFVTDAVWRDSYSLTGTLRTFYGSKGVSAAWAETTAAAKPHAFNFIENSARVTRLPSGISWVDFAYSFETQGSLPLLCNILISVTPNASCDAWKIWVLKTVLIQIKGAPSVDVYEPQIQPTGSIQYNNTTESNQSGLRVNGNKRATYDCIIVGAGQAGLNTAGRCAALGLNYLVIEKNQKVGDNWRKRYDSARLHTIREYSHMPFERTYGPSYPEFLGKDDIATGYCTWVEKYGIKISLQTSLLSGTWDKDSRKWTLHIRKDDSGIEETVISDFVVLAVGAGGQIPFIPDIPGRENFKGTVLHSEEYKSPKGFEGKHGVVVGTANTAHDVAEDMLEHNLASTTMVQRSETYVLPVDWYIKVQERTYNAHFPTELADQLGTTHPNAVLRLISMSTIHAFARQEPERFARLEQVGFRVNVFGDPAYHLLERLGGHYMDVGCSKKIADGLIKIKSDAAISHYTENGLAFTNGTEIPADIIIFATGFDLNLSNRVRDFFGDEVADCFGEFSSMNEEGEASGAYRFYHPGLACHGGAIGASRWYSRFLALHMKAALMGAPFEVYDATPVAPQLQK